METKPDELKDEAGELEKQLLGHCSEVSSVVHEDDELLVLFFLLAIPITGFLAVFDENSVLSLIVVIEASLLSLSLDL